MNQSPPSSSDRTQPGGLATVNSLPTWQSETWVGATAGGDPTEGPAMESVPTPHLPKSQTPKSVAFLKKMFLNNGTQTICVS